MLKIRISYTKNDEMQQAVELIKERFDIISLNEGSNSNNPKYNNSKYKLAYLDVERKEV